ncbi:MAG: methyltransferase domain-containing protein [Alphaproteobacteria bacterium]
MADRIDVFDRVAQRRNRARAARAADDGAEFLVREIAARLVERLGEVKRSFGLALDLGCRRGAVAAALLASASRDQVDTLVQCDVAPGFAARAASLRLPTFAADEERLPLAPRSLDLVFSNLALHWVNDLPGALIQINRALKPDGLLLASLLGGGTLGELRQALLQAETEIEGGASPRVSPVAELRDLGALLQRAGFALPMVDRDTIDVTYADAFALMRDLRAMGETNVATERHRGFSRRSTFLRAAEIYAARFPAPAASDGDGRIRATFEVVYLTAWAPSPTQPKPLQPGSAAHRLADALNTAEHDAGDIAAPKPHKN